MFQNNKRSDGKPADDRTENQRKEEESKKSISKDIAHDVANAIEKRKLHQDATDLFDYYSETYVERISDKKPIFNWGACERQVKPYIKKYGLETMKKIVDVYTEDTKNDLYKKNAWNLSCMLSPKVLNILYQRI